MAAVAIDRQSATAWPAQPQFNARPRFQTGPPTYIPEPESPLPPHNDVELSRDMLINILEYFSQLVAQLFTGRTIRMVVHGGACMLLHPGLYNISQQQQQMIPSLPRRTTTRDVDYIHRSFVTELASCGMPDAAVKLQECIKSTARYFRLGADWMNSHADIALPMAHDPSGKVYDPIYEASIKQNNIELHTIFRSTNGILTLISVTPFWAVSLKLVRYTRWDPGDICLLLRNGMVLSGTVWTPETVEDWLFRNCWPMGYHNFDSRKKADMRARILHAIELLSKWSSAVKTPEKSISAHDAMGGGDVMGGGEFGGNNGWGYSFGKWPNQAQQQQQQQQQPQQPPQQQQLQAQVSSAQFPIPTPTPAAGPVNVRDWVKDDDPPIPSPQRNKTSNRLDIFIPPEDDWINPNHPPISFRPRSRNPTPDPSGWFHSGELSNDNNNNNNNFPPGSRVPRADPYSLESFDRSINSMLHDSHHRGTSLVPPNSQRGVIPINVARKQNEMRRKKERKRERQSKWIPLSGPVDSDVSDSSDEEEPPRRMNTTWYPPPPNITAHQPPQLRLPIPPPPPPMHPQSRQDPPSHHHLPHPGLTSGPVPVSIPPPQQQPPPPIHVHIGLHSPPQSLGPAQLAQYQFEQQHQVYHFQKQQQEHQQYQQHQQQQQQQQQYHHHHQAHPQVQPQQQSSWQNSAVTIYR